MKYIPTKLNVTNLIHGVLAVLFTYFVAKSWNQLNKGDMGVTSKIIHRPVIAPHFSICLDKLIEGVTAKNVKKIMGSLDTDISGFLMNMTVDYRKNYVQITDLRKVILTTKSEDPYEH